MEQKTRVLIADDRPRSREGLRALAATWPRVEVVGEAGDGQEAVQLVEAKRPDVVLMDVRMPGMDGLDATRLIKGRWPRVRVVTFTMFPMHIKESLSAGADAFLVKGCSSEELLGAICEPDESKEERRDPYITSGQDQQAGEANAGVRRTVSQGGSVNLKAKEWIGRHPLEAFFLVGIALGFGTLFPVIFIIPQQSTLGQIASLYLARIGVYSPVLAGMFVARVIQPGRQRVSLTRRLLVFLPVWFIAEIIHVASLSLVVQPGTSLVVLSVLSLPVALLPALVISAAFSGADGVKQMLATLVRPTGRIGYYLVALLTFPVIQIGGVGITNVLNGRPWFPQVSQGAGLAVTLFIDFLSVLLFSGGINEESGWRGFAQSRLQAKYSPLVANLILWFMMVIWHIPNDMVQYRDSGYLLVRLALYPFITILFGWIYNRTRGSILAPAIFHTSMNSMNPLMAFFPITTAGNILLVSLAIVAVVSDRMWRKLPGQHPAVHQEIVPAGSNAGVVAANRLRTAVGAGR